MKDKIAWCALPQKCCLLNIKGHLRNSQWTINWQSKWVFLKEKATENRTLNYSALNEFFSTTIHKRLFCGKYEAIVFQSLYYRKQLWGTTQTENIALLSSPSLWQVHRWRQEKSIKPHTNNKTTVAGSNWKV